MVDFSCFIGGVVVLGFLRVPVIGSEMIQMVFKVFDSDPVLTEVVPGGLFKRILRVLNVVLDK